MNVYWPSLYPIRVDSNGGSDNSGKIYATVPLKKVWHRTYIYPICNAPLLRSARSSRPVQTFGKRHESAIMESLNEGSLLY